MAPLRQLLSFAFLATTVFTSPIELSKRASIDHDAVVGFPQTVPSGTLGSLYLKYKPYLHTVNGCVPYPAVDAEGNTRCALSHPSPVRHSPDKLTQFPQRRSQPHRRLLQRLQHQHRPDLRPRRILQRPLRNHVRVVLAQRRTVGWSGA